jgi:hypothetical protein
LAHFSHRRETVALTFADKKGNPPFLRMSTSPAGTSTPAGAGDDAGNTASGSGQRRKKKNRQAGRGSRFEGKCEDIKNSVYDVVSGKDTFAKTTREIAEYVGREFDDGAEFRTGMVEMRLPPLVVPPVPAANDAIGFELWKMARQRYEKQSEARRKNSGKAYALVLGQCSQALRNRMEASERWSQVNDASDVMELLKLVQSCMIQRQTRQEPTHSLWEAETQVYCFKQKGLANNDYYEKFKDLVTNAE